jgi:hypothetical protein
MIGADAVICDGQTVQDYYLQSRALESSFFTCNPAGTGVCPDSSFSFPGCVDSITNTNVTAITESGVTYFVFTFTRPLNTSSDSCDISINPDVDTGVIFSIGPVDPDSVTGLPKHHYRSESSFYDGETSTLITFSDSYTPEPTDPPTTPAPSDTPSPSPSPTPSSTPDSTTPTPTDPPGTTGSDEKDSASLIKAFSAVLVACLFFLL